MNDKNIEEKVKTPEQRGIEYGNKYGYSYETRQALANAYTAGCLSYAVFDAHDQSDTLAQHKEALRELVDDIEEREFTELFEDLIMRAKQLLNNDNQ